MPQLFGPSSTARMTRAPAESAQPRTLDGARGTLTPDTAPGVPPPAPTMPTPTKDTGPCSRRPPAGGQQKEAPIKDHTNPEGHGPQRSRERGRMQMGSVEAHGKNS